MRIQYGTFLTVFAVFAAAAASSIEDVLAGIPSSQLDNILGDLDYLGPDYNGASDYEPKSYEYDYQQAVDLPPQVVAQRADGTSDVNDVPKTEPAISQGNQAHSSSSMLPAYCDPPNPCPLGYTAADGCIEDFENTSEFSRRYQSHQKCICDTEHMFDCPEENTHRGEDDIAAVNILAGIPGIDVSTGGDGNPYMEGQKLPVAAKKGMF